MDRRRALNHRRGLGRVRRRLGQRRRQRHGARLGPDPLAEAARLSGGPLRRQQLDVGGDRHPDPAVDSDDSLRARQRRERRRPLHVGCSARPADGGRLHRDLLVDREAPRLRVGGIDDRSRRARAARAASRARRCAADPHSGRLALRLRDADRDRRPGRRLRPGAQRPALPGSHLASVPGSDGRRRRRHRRGHARDHGQRRRRLDPHLRPGADALRRMGRGDDPDPMAGHPGHQHPPADRRHAARPAASHPAARADLRAAGGLDRARPGAARPHHDPQPRHRALYAADRHHPVHLLLDRPNARSATRRGSSGRSSPWRCWCCSL